MRALLLLFAFLAGCSIAFATDLNEEFAEGRLPRAHWCACQADEKLLEFPGDEDGNRDFFARITVDKTISGEKDCDYSLCTVHEVAPEPHQGEKLGPSLMIAPMADMFIYGPGAKKPNPHCPVDNPKGDECMQRQELRLTRTYQYPFEQRVDYTIRFRMPGEVGNNTDSIRWVIAQWKQEPANPLVEPVNEEDWQPSPFLAQRYDDGIFHVTIQDGDCRCVVAAEKKPDYWKRDWEDGGPPPHCMYTYPSSREREECQSSLILDFEGEPKLHSPKGVWTEMKYEVQPGRKGSGGKISIIQDENPVVTVTGKIGYNDAPNHKQKFKMGHYRDIMDTTDSTDVDRVTVGAK